MDFDQVKEIIIVANMISEGCSYSSRGWEWSDEFDAGDRVWQYMASDGGGVWVTHSQTPHIINVGCSYKSQAEGILTLLNLKTQENETI